MANARGNETHGPGPAPPRSACRTPRCRPASYRASSDRPPIGRRSAHGWRTGPHSKGVLLRGTLPYSDTATGPAENTGLKPSPQNPFNGFVTVDPTVSLHYLDFGGEGDPVLPLAGLGNTPNVFRDLAPLLTDHYRVRALTRRGFARLPRCHLRPHATLRAFRFVDLGYLSGTIPHRCGQPQGVPGQPERRLRCAVSHGGGNRHDRAPRTLVYSRRWYWSDQVKAVLSELEKRVGARSTHDSRLVRAKP